MSVVTVFLKSFVEDGEIKMVEKEFPEGNEIVYWLTLDDAESISGITTDNALSISLKKSIETLKKELLLKSLENGDEEIEIDGEKYIKTDDHLFCKSFNIYRPANQQMYNSYIIYDGKNIYDVSLEIEKLI